MQECFNLTFKDLSALAFFRKTANSPKVIAECLFANAGRAVIIDQGYFSVISKFALKLLDWNLLANIMNYAISTNEDYLSLRKLKMKKSDSGKLL